MFDRNELRLLLCANDTIYASGNSQYSSMKIITGVVRLKIVEPSKNLLYEPMISVIQQSMQ